jgi:hypothetical protein|tara:strand:+ start:126 stop:326 length:201 start_codon:yes stop_codon:yes gene_type:complete
MPKIRANQGVTPLANEYRNSDSMTEFERDLAYAKLRSADDPTIEVGTTQNRGETTGMVSISNKISR